MVLFRELCVLSHWFLTLWSDDIPLRVLWSGPATVFMEVGSKIERVRGCWKKNSWQESWVTGSAGVHLPAWGQAMAQGHSRAFF